MIRPPPPRHRGPRPPPRPRPRRLVDGVGRRGHAVLAVRGRLGDVVDGVPFGQRRPRPPRCAALRSSAATVAAAAADDARRSSAAIAGHRRLERRRARVRGRRRRRRAPSPARAWASTSRRASSSIASIVACAAAARSFARRERAVEPLVAEHAFQHLVALRRRRAQELREPVLRQHHRPAERVEVEPEQLHDRARGSRVPAPRSRGPRARRRPPASRSSLCWLWPLRRSPRCTRQTWPSTSNTSSTCAASASWWISERVSRSTTGVLP